MRVITWVGVSLTFIAMAVLADTVSVPNTFSNGSMADASAVNANFSAVTVDPNEPAFNDQSTSSVLKIILMKYALDARAAECGIAADCGNSNQCLIYDCVDSMCIAIDVKSEGDLIWQEDFEEGTAPGDVPIGWTRGPGPFFWATGFSDSVSAPFSLETNGPNDALADTGTVTLPDMTIPSGGGFFSYYLLLSRSPAYQSSADTVNDVLAVLIDGQLVNIENTHNPSFVELVIDLPAATYADQSISISFEWRSGDNSVAKVIIDSLSLRAHAPCNDNNICTSDDLCTVGSCGGTIIPDCN